jgi:hypothetical protein
MRLRFPRRSVHQMSTRKRADQRMARYHDVGNFGSFRVLVVRKDEYDDEEFKDFSTMVIKRDEIRGSMLMPQRSDKNSRSSVTCYLGLLLPNGSL